MFKYSVVQYLQLTMQQGDSPKHTDKITKEHFRTKEWNNLNNHMATSQLTVCVTARGQTEGKNQPTQARSESAEQA